MNEQTKTERAFIRVNEQEKEYLMKRAKDNGLSFSEYIRVRLLEEQPNKASSYQKDMTTFAVLGYYLTGKLAKKLLTQEDLDECNKRAELFLKEYNMMPE